MTRSALLLGLLLWGAGGFAQNETSSFTLSDGPPITVVIQDEQLRPLVGAFAEVSTLSRLFRLEKSNEKGETTFWAAPELRYMLRVRHIGYVDWYKPVPMEALSLKFLRIEMEPMIISTDSTTTVGKKKLTEPTQRKQSSPRE